METLLRKDGLAPLQVIADAHGGQGKVFEVPRVRIYGQPAVYKEYHRHMLSELDVDHLHRMVIFPSGLTESKRLELYRIAAWPTAVVEDRGQTSGFVMPRVSDDFFRSLRLPLGREKVLAAYQLLLNSDDYLRNAEISVNDIDRIRLALSVVDALKFLHSLHITVGDFSPNNVLFDLEHHRSFFIDCDAMLLDGAGVLPQGETPDWEVGGGEPLGTVQSDVFKFGLLFLRLFAGDQMFRDPKVVNDRIPSDLFEMLRLSLSKKAAERPSLNDWLTALRKYPTDSTLPRAYLSSGALAQSSTHDATSHHVPATSSPRRKSKKKFYVAALSVIAAALLIITAVIVSHGGNENDRNTAPAVTGESREPPTSDTPSGSKENSSQRISWSTTAQDITEAPTGTRIAVFCPRSGTPETVYGTDLYTDDSSLCTAAVHAGVISFEGGGKVTIIIRPGSDEYLGSVRNGVTSSDWNSTWDRSFEVLGGRSQSRTQAQRISWSKTAEDYRGQVGKKLTFECLPGGEPMGIWGTGRYTDDSSICTAGVHAGKFSLQSGGVVSIIISGSYSHFEGTTRNGVTSEEYAEWPGSFVIA